MNTVLLPITCSYEGDGEFKAVSALMRRRADDRFVVHETYRLEWREERSMESHRHFFAAVGEAHRNLPDHWAELLPTPDHLRRYALIKTGYADQRSILCANKTEAVKVAAFIKPLDEFAIVAAKEAVVTVYTAKSQSAKAMDRKEFKASKDAVLDYIASLIGTDASTLRESAEAA